MKPSIALFARLVTPTQRVAVSLDTSNKCRLDGVDRAGGPVATPRTRPPPTGAASSPARSTGRPDTNPIGSCGSSARVTGSPTSKTRMLPLEKKFCTR